MALLLVCSLSLVPHAVQAGDVRIALMEKLTSGISSLHDAAYGALVAVDLVNQHPDILPNDTVIVDVYDVDNSTVYDLTQAVLRTGASAMVAPRFTQVRNEAVPYLRPSNIPMVFFAGVVESFTTQFPAMFTNDLSVSDRVSGMVTACSSLGYEYVALLFLSNSFGREWADEIKANLQERGIELVVSVEFEDENDLPNAVDTIRRSAARVAFLVPGFQHWVDLAGLFLEHDMVEGYQYFTNTPMVHVEGVDNYMFATSVDPPSDESQLRTQFDQLYATRSHDDIAPVASETPTHAAYMTFDLTYMTLMAIHELREAKGLDDISGEDIQSVLRTFDGGFGAGGELRFSSRQTGVADTVVKKATGDSFTDVLHIYSNGTVGALQNAPPTVDNFVVDMCGLFFFRNQTSGRCVHCPPLTLNPMEDGLDMCIPCAKNEVLTGSVCKVCPSGIVRMEGGVQVCSSVDKSTDYVVLAYIFTPFCVLIAGIWIALHLRNRFNALEKEKQFLKEVSQKERLFVSYVFHEIRNPLNLVIASLRLAHDHISDIVAGTPTHSGDDPSCLFEENQRDGANYTKENPALELYDSLSNERKLDSSSTSRTLPLVDSSPKSIHSYRKGPCMSPQSSVLDVESVAADISVSLQSATDVLRVLNDVLDMSQLVQGHLVLEKSPYDVWGFVQECCKTASYSHSKTSFKSEIVDPAGLIQDDNQLWVLGDKKRMRQILTNLIGNSTKFAANGNVLVRLTVEASIPPLSSLRRDGKPSCKSTTSLSRNNKVVHSAEAGDRHVVVEMGRVRPPSRSHLPVRMKIEVIDDGCGVSPKARRYIFDPEEREVYEGTGSGIGLRLCRRIVSLMGSDLHLQSPVPPTSRGSNFYFEWNTVRVDCRRSIDGQETSFASRTVIPSCTGSVARSNEHTPRGSLQINQGTTATLPPKLSVLVVDDIPLNRKLLIRSLQRNKFKDLLWEFTEASTGEEALEIVQEQKGSDPFDIFFVDEHMGGAGGVMLGHEFVERFRAREAMANPHGSRALVVGCSGNMLSEDECTEWGIDLVWVKPFPSSDDMFDQLSSVYHRTGWVDEPNMN